MSRQWLRVLMHTKGEEKLHHLHNGSVIIGNNGQLSPLMFLARQLALLLLSYDELVINMFSMLYSFHHSTEVLYSRNILNIFTQDLTVVTTVSCENAHVHSGVPNPLLTCFYLYWQEFPQMIYDVLNRAQRLNFFFSCIWPGICPLPWNPGQGLGLSDLDKKENGPPSTAFTQSQSWP